MKSDVEPTAAAAERVEEEVLPPENPFGMPAPDYYNVKGVTHKSSVIKNSRGLSLFTQAWLPASGNPKALLFMCHGYGNDTSWLFQVIAVEFAAHGYAVFSFDYEGHGQSEGVRAGVRNFDHLVDDAIQYASEVRSRAELAGLPRFLYGESLGGAVSILVTKREPEEWSGAILASPMCKISEKMRPPWLVVQLLQLAVLVAPDAAIVPSKEILNLSFRDPEKRALAFQNPRRYVGKPRLAFAFELLRATQEIADHMEDFRVPFLALHGEKDVVTDPAVSKELYKRSQSPDKTLKLYPEGWHQLLAGEPPQDSEAIWGHVFDWIDARVAPPPKKAAEQA
eukprot:jgi/Mesen1/4728/ME000241S03764